MPSHLAILSQVRSVPEIDKPQKGSFGADIATQEIIKSLVIYCQWDVIHFVSPSTHSAQNKKQGADDPTEHQPSHFPIAWNEFIQYFESNYYTCIYCSYISLHWVIALRKINPNIHTHFIGHTHSINTRPLLFDLLGTLFAPLRRSDAIICTSTVVKKAILKTFENLLSHFDPHLSKRPKFMAHLPVIPLPVNVDLFCPRDKTVIRRDFKLPSEAVLFIWLGRFSPYTKADLFPLLLAFRESLDHVKNQDIELGLLLVGSNEEQYGGMVHHLCCELNLVDHVNLFFDVSDLAKCNLLSASDVFIAMSDNIQESYGIALTEAMAAGLPVIASDWSGHSDIISQNETGILIPTYWSDCCREISYFELFPKCTHFAQFRMAQSVAIDIDKLQAAISLMANNPQVRSQMGEAARRIACKDFSMMAFSKRFQGLLKTLDSRTHDRNGLQHFSSLQDLFIRDSFSEFSHFATKILTESDLLSLRKDNDDKKNTMDYIERIILNKIKGFINTDILSDFIKTNPCGSVSTHLQFMAEKYGLSREAGLQHLMWLTKYGILRLSAAKEDKVDNKKREDLSNDVSIQP